MSGATLHSWGRYPYHPQTATPVYWQSDLAFHLSSVVTDRSTTLPYGCGRSYGDTCLAASDKVVLTRKLNRFIQADWQKGTLLAEAGVTLKEVLDVCVPKGWFPAVTPGTKFVTLGGAVANDVHGKNHHRLGTFGNNINSFGLFRSDLGHLTCSMNDNLDLFTATIGGLGLTGIITWVKIQLLPIESSQIRIRTKRFACLKEFFELSDAHDMANEYSVAWVDCTRTGKSLGRGIYSTGNHAKSGELTAKSKRKLSVPLTPPVSLINQATLTAFNCFYYHRSPREFRSSLTYYEPYFYPLDGIYNWNRIYGQRGFQQFQCVIPEANASEAITLLLKAISEAKHGSFLAVLKRCGKIASPGLLSFPMQGISLALDFANTQNIENTLLYKLDDIVLESGGRLYPAKDAHMRHDHFKTFYPKWEMLETLRDPALLSRFWQRAIHS